MKTGLIAHVISSLGVFLPAAHSRLWARLRRASGALAPHGGRTSTHNSRLKRRGSRRVCAQPLVAQRAALLKPELAARGRKTPALLADEDSNRFEQLVRRHGLAEGLAPSNRDPPWPPHSVPLPRPSARQ